jgi:hypothetical protein
MNVTPHEPGTEAELTLRRGGWFGATLILVYLASFKLMVHLLTNGDYGYFRDTPGGVGSLSSVYPPCSQKLNFRFTEF